MARSDDCPDLLIAGCSARAAAFSAIRAGLKIATIDQFSDRDLGAIASATSTRDWPNEIAEWASTFSAAIPLLPVGGMEHFPDLLEQIGQRRTVLGSSPEVIRAVRNPWEIRRIWNSLRVETPAIAGDKMPRQAFWEYLIKPLASGGGRGIQRWENNEFTPGANCYLQELWPGRSAGAAFLASPQKIECLGVVWHLRGADSDSADEFWDAGAISAEGPVVAAAAQLGELLGRILPMQGLFNIDFLWQTEPVARCVPIEINPRYSSGMEVLEIRDRRSFVGELLGVTRSTSGGTCERQSVGKRIVYAQRACRLSLLPAASPAQIAAGDYQYADLPDPDRIHAAGEPLCSVIHSAAEADDVQSELKLLADELIQNTLV